MKNLWQDLKKKPAMLIGLLFGIVAVLYIVYKSSAANKSTSGTGAAAGSAADPNGQSGVTGGYIQLIEDVINPTPVNVNVGGSKVTVNNPKIVRAPGPSHHPHAVHTGTGGKPKDPGTFRHHTRTPISPIVAGHQIHGANGNSRTTTIKSPVLPSTPPGHNVRVLGPHMLVPPTNQHVRVARTFHPVTGKPVLK